MRDAVFYWLWCHWFGHRPISGLSTCSRCWRDEDDIREIVKMLEKALDE